LAVRQLQKKVDRIWINFEHTAEQLSVSENVVCVGNPLRSSFGTCNKAEARARLGIPEETFYVLSFGGSGGAEAINAATVELMHRFGSRANYRHLHAAGKRDYENTRARFVSCGLEKSENCILKDYIYDMPLQMAAADLVISRAGAMTISELARMGKAAILVPSPNVTDNHQFINAKTLADANAAILVEEARLAEGGLTDAMEKLMSGGIVRALEKNVLAFADRDANRLIWKEITELVKIK
jgi:UDP-N-acetylglucosamine--N-acetylmuramyl-(pentapeptide) pyrophosphoryl-undecaprenol N-acetylglucosamine transferase